jgi:hypothetical protein
LQAPSKANVEFDVVFLMQVIIPISISRVNQFDAARLDVEMSAMLKEQLLKVFSLVKVLSLLTLLFCLLSICHC